MAIDYDAHRADDGRCPYCRTELVSAVEGRFQRLTEHVLAPNRQPPRRQSYACTNLLCEANDGDRVKVWLGDGEGPFSIKKDRARADRQQEGDG